MTLMRSKMQDDNDMVTNKENPVLITGGGIYSKWEKIDLNIFGKYVSQFENERFVNVADGPQPLGNFFVLDLNAGYSTKGKLPVRFYIRVKNLTDNKYSTVNGYPDFGRMLFGGVQIRFMKGTD
jgi:outer membrane receptor protein involved in Fe transport